MAEKTASSPASGSTRSGGAPASRVDADQFTGLLASTGGLPDASSLLSSRWSRDSAVTGHLGRLYNGPVEEAIDVDSIPALMSDLQRQVGPVQAAAARMGVVTWDIACAGGAAGAPFLLQIPRALDGAGQGGRARVDAPRLNLAHMRELRARGLTRFVLEPRELLTLAGNVPAATFEALPEHRPIRFGAGALHAELAEGRLAWMVSLGPDATAALLCEMVAALAYHYDEGPPGGEGGGVTVADVSINDGDFVARRRADGAFDLRLTAVRRRERGVGPHLFLLHLVQLMAFEDFAVGGELVGLPTLLSNPSIAFAGLARGRAYRAKDLGGGEADGVAEARAWIAAFGRSREGRAYRPWADRFLGGGLPPAFGGGLRERWWRMLPLQKALGLLELKARLAPPGPDANEAAGQARELRTFLDRLGREIGRPPGDEAGLVQVNDLERDGLVGLLDEARVLPEARRAALAGEILAAWPHRGFDHLVARVPGARALRPLKSRLAFGRVVAEADQGTVRALGAPGPGAGRRGDVGAEDERGGEARGARRAIANAEIFGALALAPSSYAEATRAFPTFESYMDLALHDPVWGYYAGRVQIGSIAAEGHFNTNPEDLSPHYGRWIATRAFEAWREMVAAGEIAPTDAFPIVELGAGNGRLARDVLDALDGDGTPPVSGGAVSADASGARDAWRTFAARVRYHIYESSASLRERQRALLGDGALVAEGDARHPADKLARDFPGGLRGFVVTNEVPDAFGVHKVVLTADGHAWAALVVPRAEAALLDALGGTAAPHGAPSLPALVSAADERLRATFGLAAHAGDRYLDAATFQRVMEAVARLPAPEAERCRGLIWFEEAYVPAAVATPALGAHLAANADATATALAAEDSGVVTYVNVHASRFARELGQVLAAGLIVTIDYGDTTGGLIQGARRGDFPFRVYGAWSDLVPRPNDPYAAPGTQDLTADVNFTELARAGRDAGLQVVHYGAERDLLGRELPELLRAAATNEAVAEFLGSPIFKVLVLGKRPSAIFAAPFAAPLALEAREQDVPKARRPRIALIERNLGGRP